ncbi:succinate dehydrogenase, cytochrome b556 subunit [Alteromonas sp. 1_MG-2023]|uniref:succinate dehydrogenase, cytochrome b556 subunit n=1 Tax=Alteromonas sp. 1_MG-2023 TaxID=3062669 RepID=UPI0026E2B2C1|nr:succinate dehydrogenase, cytochrome b556 subunit [Alteromonas sp. 1_MG-2023]MDO6474612.1 succinate dehydrogenase, cytochrome b556 subunit [Alteromonas sp. 1_MG-2023]
MKDIRPRNMDLTTIKLPVMGLASILHRICAVIIWFSLAWFLPLLFLSLQGAEGFENVQSLISGNFIAQFFTWGFLTALGYYMMGGIKHLIQEFGYFETLEGGKLISQVAIASGILLSVLFGFWVWG